MAKRNFSRRAEILKRVLDCIDRGVFVDFGRFMVLGKVGVNWTGDDKDPEEVHLDLEDTGESKIRREIEEAHSQALADLDRHDAHQNVKERTSLDKPQPLTNESRLKRFMTAIVNLSPEAQSMVLRALVKQASQEKPEVVEDQQEASATVDPNDSLDLHYSREVLGKLEKIVRRASLLDRVEADKIPSESVEKYFDEAHQCFLYGFPIATAVLCRALLDARLRELSYVLDPNGKLEQEIGRRSYPKELINRAAEKGFLEDDGRPLVGRRNHPHWAEEIIDAGNWAVHKPAKFNQRYGGDEGSNRVQELLDITRKALIQLLTKQKG